MSKQCLKCGHTEAGEPVQCPNCGAIYSKLEQLSASGAPIRAVRIPTAEERAAAVERQRVLAANPALQAAQRLSEARVTGNWAGVPADLVRAEAAEVVLSTTPEIPGREVAECRAIVSAEFAFAFGAVFEELAGLVRNIAGSGKSGQTVQFLRQGRVEVLNKLRFEALDAGANAVLGVHIDYEEFSGANQRGILVVVATGTAVRLKDVSN